jgi:hypothetical protein
MLSMAEALPADDGGSALSAGLSTIDAFRGIG